MQASARYNELDWLRVIAVLVLFSYHIGMLYVDGWGFHIKSQYTSEKLAGFMLLVNPWRMPLLWFISGVATCHMLGKLSVGGFLMQRSFRLLFPLLIGVLFIVPPQLFYEMRSHGSMPLGYGDFYVEFWKSQSHFFKGYESGIWPHMDVNHLWYLRELWCFTLVLLCLVPLLHSDWFRAILCLLSGFWLFASALLLAVVAEVAFEGSREVRGFFYLLCGYVFALFPEFREKLVPLWRQLWPVFLLLSGFLIGFYFVLWVSNDSAWVKLMGRVIYSVSGFVGVALMLSLAMRFLTFETKWLAKASGLVFPFYIFHQSVIIVVAAELGGIELGAFIEPVLVFICSLLITCILVWLVYCVSVFRPCFGLRSQWNISSGIKPLGVILILPIAIEILI